MYQNSSHHTLIFQFLNWIVKAELFVRWKAACLAQIAKAFSQAHSRASHRGSRAGTWDSWDWFGFGRGCLTRKEHTASSCRLCIQMALAFLGTESWWWIGRWNTMARTQILFKCFSAKQWNNLWILQHGSLQEPELSRFPENAIMAGAGVNEPSETATAWEDHCSDFFIVIPMPLSKYLAISKLMQIDNSCYPRDQTLNPSCVWQGWVVTHWVFGTDHSSCDQYPTGLWSLLGSVLGILQPALPWNICTQPELNSCAVLPPARTDVLRCFPFPSELHP